jgi:hypothetical protein
MFKNLRLQMIANSSVKNNLLVLPESQSKSEKGKRKGKNLFPSWKTAHSLKPGPALMDAFVSGRAEAAAIVDSWKFNFPIPSQPADEFDALVERCGNMTFTGRIKDIDDNYLNTYEGMNDEGQ